MFNWVPGNYASSSLKSHKIPDQEKSEDANEPVCSPGVCPNTPRGRIFPLKNIARDQKNFKIVT